MPSRPKAYTCLTCGKEFLSSNPKPQYCSRPCRDQNPARKARYSAMFRVIPDRPCVICGKLFKPAQETMNNGTPVLCCSFACSRLKARKHQREDITECLICGKALSKRQVSNQNRYCSRACGGKNLEQWHKKPENKTFMQQHGARSYTARQQAPTSIERALVGAMDRAGIVYEFQKRVDGYVCDFVIPSAMLVIEADGTYWHALPRAVVRDKNKDAYLNKCGYTVLRFSEAEIKQNVDRCVQVILSHL